MQHIYVANSINDLWIFNVILWRQSRRQAIISTYELFYVLLPLLPLLPLAWREKSSFCRIDLPLSPLLIRRISHCPVAVLKFFTRLSFGRHKTRTFSKFQCEVRYAFLSFAVSVFVSAPSIVMKRNFPSPPTQTWKTSILSTHWLDLYCWSMFFSPFVDWRGKWMGKISIISWRIYELFIIDLLIIDYVARSKYQSSYF